MAVEVELIDSYSGFSKLEPFWNKVLEASEEPSIFLSYEWLSNWWRVSGKENRILTLIAKEGGEIIGLAPLMITRKNALFLWAKTLEFAAAPVSDYQDFIIVRNGREVIQAFIRTLFEHSRLWNYFYIRSIREDSKNLNLLREILSERRLAFRLDEYSRAYFLPLKGSWEEQYKALKRNAKSDVRRRINRLEREGALSYFSIRSKEDIDRFLPVLFDQPTKRWMEKYGVRSRFYDERFEGFIRNIVETARVKGFLDFTGLRLDDNVIALHIGLSHHFKYYYFIPTFDLAYRDFSPGKVLIYHMLKTQSENRVTEFDFLRGEEDYKSGWSEQYRELFRLYASSNTAKGRLILFWMASARPFLKKLLPKKLRRPLSQ